MRWPRLLILALLAWIASTPRVAEAHEFRPAVLSLRQSAPGQFAWRWQPALDQARNPIEAVHPIFPEHCQALPGWIDCDGRGIGSIEVAGLERYPVDVVVRVRWTNGRERTAVLHGEEARAALGDATDGDSTLDQVTTYLALGVEHILIGIDHVLFVLGLLLLVGWRRRLVWAVTGFTAAHSITLAASTLDIAALPQGPVEAVIALSIVLLAVELVHERDTLTRRAPGVVAFTFGLLHGFGFAGALREIGIPPDQAWPALLGFNIGVELGQLLIIGVALAIGFAARRLPHTDRLRLLAIYAGGTVASYWAIERIANEF